MHASGAEQQAVPSDVQLYSIGHSDHSVSEFLDLLRRYRLTVVVDVRSQPYSQWASQFNRESLERDLRAAGVRYLFMGDALGGRPADHALYDPGEEHPNYERLAQSPAYKAAIEQLLQLAQTERVAIMCSEGDHTKCHRAKLITPTLLERGVHVLHIRPDGTQIEAQPEARQLRMLGT